MRATATDYQWIDDWNHGLLNVGYCLTFVRELTPSQVLDRLEVGQRIELHGARAADERASEAWSTSGDRELFVAVTHGDGWSVMFESNGFVGVTQSVMAPVSVGTSTVSHYRNVNALDQFLWLEDGKVSLQFEPLLPSGRLGARADEIVPEMEGAGFDLREGEERTFADCTAAAFALAERITGVRVTPDLLDDAEFVGALVPITK